MRGSSYCKKFLWFGLNVIILLEFLDPFLKWAKYFLCDPAK